MQEPHNSIQETGETLRIGDQLVRFDRQRTVDSYKAIEQSWADACKCIPCRNFIAQRNTAFPPSFLNLLDRLGIDSSKEGEVYGCYPRPSGMRLYGGWFFFSGLLLEKGERNKSEDGVSYFVIGPGGMPSPNPRDAFGLHPLSLDFEIEIPWVLTDVDPDELFRVPAKKLAGGNHG